MLKIIIKIPTATPNAPIAWSSVDTLYTSTAKRVAKSILIPNPAMSRNVLNDSSEISSPLNAKYMVANDMVKIHRMTITVHISISNNRKLKKEIPKSEMHRKSKRKILFHAVFEMSSVAEETIAFKQRCIKKPMAQVRNKLIK